MPPAVSIAFNWLDEETNNKSLVVAFPWLQKLESMVIVHGMPTALAFAICENNSGPLL